MSVFWTQVFCTISLSQRYLLGVSLFKLSVSGYVCPADYNKHILNDVTLSSAGHIYIGLKFTVFENKAGNPMVISKYISNMFSVNPYKGKTIFQPNFNIGIANTAGSRPVQQMPMCLHQSLSHVFIIIIIGIIISTQRLITYHTS